MTIYGVTAQADLLSGVGDAAPAETRSDAGISHASPFSQEHDLENLISPCAHLDALPLGPDYPEDAYCDQTASSSPQEGAPESSQIRQGAILARDYKGEDHHRLVDLVGTGIFLGTYGIPTSIIKDASQLEALPRVPTALIIDYPDPERAGWSADIRAVMEYDFIMRIIISNPNATISTTFPGPIIKIVNRLPSVILSAVLDNSFVDHAARTLLGVVSTHPEIVAALYLLFRRGNLIDLDDLSALSQLNERDIYYMVQKLNRMAAIRGLGQPFKLARNHIAYTGPGFDHFTKELDCDLQRS
jgi:hypothetical protein